MHLANPMRYVDHLEVRQVPCIPKEKEMSPYWTEIQKATYEIVDGIPRMTQADNWKDIRSLTQLASDEFGELDLTGLAEGSILKVIATWAKEYPESPKKLRALLIKCEGVPDVP